MTLGLSLSLSRPGPTYSAEASAYFAAMSVQPDGARKTTIDTLIASLKAAGVWSKLDWLCLHAAHHEQAGRINLIDPTEIATAPVAPTFTVDRHYQGNGTTQYLNSGWDATLNGPHQYSQNSSHIGLFVLTDVGGTSGFDIGGIVAAQGSMSIRARATAASLARARISSSAVFDATLPAATAVGHTCFTRTTSTNIDGYKDGVSMGTGVAASATPLANSFVAICGNSASGAMSTFTNTPISVSHWGGGLTAGEIASLRTALVAYLTAIGAL